MYILRREQHLKTSLATIWDFLKNPHNLNTITPPDLHFEIISTVPDEMYNGLIIEYQIRIPMIGRQKWVTEIKHICTHNSFVDEQRIGPYSFWYHHHQIEQIELGVKSCDTVYYLPPFGLFGKMLNALYIRKNLERIFDYRRDRLFEILSRPSSSIDVR